MISFGQGLINIGNNKYINPDQIISLQADDTDKAKSYIHTNNGSYYYLNDFEPQQIASAFVLAQQTGDIIDLKA